MAMVIGRDGDPVRGSSERSAEADGDEPAPVRDTRFQKGNKFGKGRPKGAKNLKTIVLESHGMKVEAKVGGKVQKLSKIELALHQNASKASAGDDKAIDRAITLYERYGPQEDPAGPSPEQTRADLATLRDYLALWDLFGGENDEGGDA